MIKTSESFLYCFYSFYSFYKDYVCFYNCFYVVCTSFGSFATFTIQATGGLAAQYAAALREHGFKNCTSGNCGSQAGQMGDVLLHETAVAWTDTATLEQ